MLCIFRACDLSLPYFPFVLGLLRFFKFALQVSSIRASKSDDKRLSIFTGTKTLHLRSVSKEDRFAWIEALLAAKDLFPRTLASNDFASTEDIVVSTEKLRIRLLQEGIGEAVIKDCESIMLLELSELQNQLKALQYKHVMLLDSLRQLEVFFLFFPFHFSILVHYSALKDALKCRDYNHPILLGIELDSFCSFFKCLHGVLSFCFLGLRCS